MKTKCSLDQRISKNWLRIKLLKYFHRTETGLIHMRHLIKKKHVTLHPD